MKKVTYNTPSTIAFDARTSDMHGKFIDAIHTDEVIGHLLIVNANGANTKAQRFCCQIEIVADMTGDHQNFLVGGNPKLPLCPFWDGGSHK